MSETPQNHSLPDAFHFDEISKVSQPAKKSASRKNSINQDSDNEESSRLLFNFKQVARPRIKRSFAGPYRVKLSSYFDEHNLKTQEKQEEIPQKHQDIRKDYEQKLTKCQDKHKALIIQYEQIQQKLAEAQNDLKCTKDELASVLNEYENHKAMTKVGCNYLL